MKPRRSPGPHPILFAGPSTAWQESAACRDHEPALWDFDDRDWPKGVLICGTCPVVDACLAAAMAREGRSHGNLRAMVYGGLTPPQRARLARGRAAGAPHAPDPALPAPRWPDGAPCVVCGTPCASDKARRRDPDLRDRYGRHYGRGLCHNCQRRAKRAGDAA